MIALKRTRISQVLASGDINAKITVMGWVRTRRDSKGGFSFIELNDGSCLNNLQIIVDNSVENYEADVLKLTTGSSVSIEGKLVESPGKGQKVELQAKKVTVYGVASEDYPLEKKRHFKGILF